MNILSFLIRRVTGTLVVLLGIATITFFLIHALPGTPWDTSERGKTMFSTLMVDDNTLRTLNHRFGLDLPLWRQYTRFLIGDFGPDGFECGYVCGNLGPSMTQKGRTVGEILFERPEHGTAWESRFGYTVRLAGLALLITLVVGLPLGVSSAMRRNTRFDLGANLTTAVSISVPNFVLGLLLIILLASNLHLISVRPNWDRFTDWLTPAVILAVAPIGMLARLTRTAVLDALQGDYVRTARAKGLNETHILSVHVMKNAAIPIITHLGPMLFELIAASFVIEVMFSFPGFGREYYEAVRRLDYSMILALTVFYGFFVALANLFTDVMYAVLDPRVKLS